MYRERTQYLSELIDKLNEAFGKNITDTDKVAFAVHVSEKLRTDSVVMDQVQNNTREQAMKADLPMKAIQAIAGAMSSHQTMATQLLSDESTRDLFLTVVYELLKKDAGSGLLEQAR
jgi:type I restriction enzyme R subunit